MADDSEAWKGDSDSESPVWPSFGKLLFKPPTAEEREENARAYRERAARGEANYLTMQRLSLARPCPKCGHTKVRVRYAAPGSHGCLDHAGAHEHLHRACKRCRFDWPEKPLDADA